MLPRAIPYYGNLDAYGNWGDLANDARWRRVTPRHVLNHATGFANFAFLESQWQAALPRRSGRALRLFGKA
ncbi:hypothetical protein AB5I41_03480 [Sphingomonas sp. MMS24-JH45]